MKSKEIRKTDKNIINEKILELQKELVKINAQVAIGTSIKNPGQVKNIKKTIARILTIITENNKEGKKEAKRMEADKKG
jgi:large subunit ribosomal protein L29